MVTIIEIFSMILALLPGTVLHSQCVAEAATSESTPIIVGEWSRTDGVDRYKIFANKTLQTTIEGKVYRGVWSYDGSGGYKYIFDWEHRPSPEKAPFKDWITVAPDGQTYSGYNNYGDHVHCVRVSHDISLDDACLIQVVKDPKTLIVDKKAAICINVTSTFNEPVYAEIEVVYDFGSKTYVEKGRDGKGVPINPGRNTIYLPGGPVTPGDASPWMEPGKGSYLLWSTTGNDDGARANLHVQIPLNQRVSAPLCVHAQDDKLLLSRWG